MDTLITLHRNISSNREIFMKNGFDTMPYNTPTQMDNNYKTKVKFGGKKANITRQEQYTCNFCKKQTFSKEILRLHFKVCKHF